ncbi:MAG TPA: OmpH family outer membrane protein [Panacibacter sp.]|nr:OmpH family outer membrane protein [Panacibacter sp.]HNP44326.1 OmpH family outer membrane protein [Panacibacter sp.]
MQKVSIVLNAILLVAVGYLYYEHYAYINQDEHKLKQNQAAVANSFKIAYFELDSLQNHYEYYKEVRDYLSKKDQDNQSQLNKIKGNYMAKAKEFNDKGSQLSQNEAEEYQRLLMKLQNDYNEAEQNLNNEMQSVMAEKLSDVKMKIQDFLKNYCADKGYAYVFASNDQDYLYYKDSIRNITPDVLTGLNASYQKSKTK